MKPRTLIYKHYSKKPHWMFCDPVILNTLNTSLRSIVSKERLRFMNEGFVVSINQLLQAKFIRQAQPKPVYVVSGQTKTAYERIGEELMEESKRSKIDIEIERRMNKEKLFKQELAYEESRQIQRRPYSQIQISAPEPLRGELIELAHEPGLFGNTSPDSVLKIINEIINIEILKRLKTSAEEYRCAIIALIRFIADMKPRNTLHAYAIFKMVIAGEIASNLVSMASTMVDQEDHAQTMKLAIQFSVQQMGCNNVLLKMHQNEELPAYSAVHIENHRSEDTPNVPKRNRKKKSAVVTYEISDATDLTASEQTAGSTVKKLRRVSDD